MGLANWFSTADRAQMALERILLNCTVARDDHEQISSS